MEIVKLDEIGFEWPNGTKPELRELLNGDLQIVDAIEDAPLVTIKGHNGVSPIEFMCAVLNA